MSHKWRTIHLNAADQRKRAVQKQTDVIKTSIMVVALMIIMSGYQLMEQGTKRFDHYIYFQAIFSNKNLLSIEHS